MLEQPIMSFGGGMAISRPIIFLGLLPGGSNRRSQKEIKGIQQLIEPLADRCHLVQAVEETGDGLLKLLESYQFAENIAVLHLCGSRVMGLTPEFEAQLLTLIDRLPGLKVIFLSGNASFEWLDYLLSRDIPLIIALNEYRGSRFTTSIVRLFYGALLQGDSLQEAVRRIKLHYGHRFFSHVVRYDIDSNSFEWPGRNRQEQTNQVSWGAYSLADRLPHWHWRLVTEELNLPPDPLLLVRDRSLSILSLLLGLGLLALVGRWIWGSLGAL